VIKPQSRTLNRGGTDWRVICITLTHQKPMH
jgi:hypothetical protein